MPVWLGRRFPPDQLVSGGTWPQLPGQSSGCEDKLCLWVRVATFCPLLLPPPPPPPPPAGRGMYPGLGRVLPGAFGVFLLLACSCSVWPGVCSCVSWGCK